jgi:hypothetical protein
MGDTFPSPYAPDDARLRGIVAGVGWLTNVRPAGSRYWSNVVPKARAIPELGPATVSRSSFGEVATESPNERKYC